MRRSSLLLLVVLAIAPPVALAASKVLYQADLSNRKTGWPSKDSKSESVGYVTGGYRILTKRGQFDYQTPSVKIGATVRSLQVETDATEIAAKGAHVLGVGCLSGDAGAGYLLGASPDNGYANVSKFTPDGSVQFLKQGGNGIAVPRVHVRLRADCIAARSGQPAKLTLDLNGKRIISTTDRHGVKSFDRVGLFALTVDGRVDVVFHRIVAQQP